MDNAFFYTLGYQYGSQIWNEAVQAGKIQKNEFLVDANSERGLGDFTVDELREYTFKASSSFFFSPRYWFRELIDAFNKRDFRYINAGLRIFFKVK